MRVKETYFELLRHHPYFSIPSVISFFLSVSLRVSVVAFLFNSFCFVR